MFHRDDESRGQNQDTPSPWTVFYQMYHREPPHPTAAVRKAFCLTLGLLPAIALAGEYALPRPRLFVAIVNRVVETTPYLPVRGAPALRFQPAPSRPDLDARTIETSSDALIRSERSHGPDHIPAAAPTNPPVVSESTDRIAEAEKPPGSETGSAPSTTPARILPDEARPTVRPEDFLPYFQIPGSARESGDVTLLVPVPKSAPTPANLPASSATYTQSPR